MPKKAVPRKKISSNNVNVERALTDNFIALQKVMTNLAVKFDDLSSKITKLLDLFEISAKAFAEKDLDFGGGKKEISEVSGKLDKLLDQNKVLAKGISLLHEIPEHPQKTQEPLPEPEKIKPVKKSSTHGFQMDFQKKRAVEEGEENYQRSISAEPEQNEKQSKSFP
jgi:hypothetical protein